jgi:hypothetical protein
MLRRSKTIWRSVLVLLLGLAVREAQAQGLGRAGGTAGSPTTARAAAPQDLTGYWVSVVTEHWHLRMRVPPRGDFSMLPLNAEAVRIANTWDAAKEVAGGDQCKSYGAAAIMRVPGRLYVHWADENTLQVDTDSGTQTRLFHFGGAAPANMSPQVQGYSAASWEGLGRGGPLVAPGAAGGQLKVTTTHMRSGYLRKNGVPYSENAVLEEYFDRFSEPNGDTWFVVTTILTDPQYLSGPYVTTNHFKKIQDRSGWDPTPCRADEPR